MRKYTNYYCPACSSVLNVENNVVLAFQNNKGQGGIIFLDTELGDYTKVKHSSLEIKKDEIVKLFCPVCHKDLLCLPDYNLARLVMKDDSGENLTVLFSVKFDWEETYVLKAEKIHKTYGKDIKEIDFENLSLCK